MVGWLLILGLLLLHGTVVIDEDVGALVFGVGVAGSALVAGTKVTLWLCSVVDFLVNDAVRTDGS